MIHIFIIILLVPHLILGQPAFYENLREAKKSYDHFEIENAISILQNTLKTSDLKSIPTQHLKDAHLLLALSFATKNSQTQAQSAFFDLLELDPQVSLSEDEYGPKIQKIFQKSKTNFFKDYYYMALTSSPHFATLFIDGVERGETPLTVKLSRHEPHKIEIRQSEYEMWSESFAKEIPDQLLKRDITLKKISLIKNEELGNTVSNKAPAWISKINPLTKDEANSKESQLNRNMSHNVYEQDSSTFLSNWWFWAAAATALIAVGSYAYLNNASDTVPNNVVYEDKTLTQVRIMFP